MNKKKGFTSILILLFLSNLCFAQFIFKGKIIGDDSTALQGVSIIVNKKGVASTDAGGNFQFLNPHDTLNISFSYTGYKTTGAIFSASQYQVVTLVRSLLFMEEAVIKTFESNSILKNIPATVSILAKTDLDRYANTSFIPAVNSIPGVKMDERSPGSYRLSIRGNLLRSPFGVRNVKVYWNGIPFTDANGNTYLNQIGFNNIDRIEILKGPGGSMYGAGTGGVVLISNNNKTAPEKAISFNTVIGSFGTITSDVSYKKITANSSSSFSYAHQQSEGWRNHTNMRRDAAHYTGSFTINKKQAIHANIFYSDLYYQTPGGLTQRQMDSAAKQSRPASGTFKSAEAQHAAIMVKTGYAGLANECRFNDHWRNITSIYISSTRFKNPGILNFQRKTEQGIGGRSVTSLKQKNISLHFGGEYQFGFTSTRTFGNKLGMPDTLQFDDEIAATQYNLFAQLDIQLSKSFNINGGLSYNNYSYGFLRLNKMPVTEINKIFDPVLVPRIAVIKKFGNNYSVYSSVSKGFSPPTIDEIVPSAGVFNDNLQAEKAINYEMGFRAEITNRFYFSVAHYYLQLNNTIVTRRDSSGADYFVNTGNTNQRGSEIAINYLPVRNNDKFLRELKLWMNYTNIIAQFKNYQQGSSDYSGNKLTGTPPNVFVAGADAITSIGLYANFTYNYTDAIPLNDANTFSATQYHLLFIKTGYKKLINKKIQGEIYFSYDQSFNTPYSLGNDLNAAGNRYYNPSAPQNFSGGVQLKFNL